MSTEREIAFLDSVLAGDEEDGAMHRNGHPEPSILWVLTQPERAGDAMAAELREHVATCTFCADLTKRLQAFHDTNQTKPELADLQQWENAEPRLDQWMTDFLKSQATQNAVKDSLSTPPRASLFRWSRSRWPRNFWGSVGFQIAVASCAVALLVVGVMEFQRSDRGRRGAMGELASPLSSSKNENAPTPRPPDDQTVLLNDSKEPATVGSDTVPQSLMFSSGQVLTVTITALEAQSDGTSKVTGKLLPFASGQDTLGTSEISGVMTQSPQDFPTTFLVREIAWKGKEYHPFPLAVANDEQTLILLRLADDKIPEASGTTKFKVVKSQTFVVGP